MQIVLEPDQSELLREILDSALKELRFESARTDSRGYREALHQRERLVESVIDQLRELPT